MKNNNDTYERSNVIAEYKNKDRLTPPEIAILKIIERAGLESMLDIGVGTGRTTLHYAPLFKKYIGIDYSKRMVEASKKRFSLSPEFSFEYCDATNMSMFEDNSFDFILFSFNGIDCVSYEERLKILKEIKRIGKADSFFAFSTHNLYNAPLLYSFQFPKNPFKYFREYKRSSGVNKLNPPLNEILKKDSITLIDGDIDFSAEYFYYKPEKQIKELIENGFDNIGIFSLKSGKELAGNTKWENINDPWLYFLCKNIKI